MGRIIALDFGTVRIGVAISDENQIIATPLGIVLNNSNFSSQLQKLLQHLTPPEKIILGLPLKLNGQESEMSKKVRLFAQTLEKKFQLPVELWDERLTSALVERTLLSAELSRKKRAQLSDTLSAVCILQSYLETIQRSHFIPILLFVSVYMI